MSETNKTRREKSVAWQNRYITPVLLTLGLIAVAASWAAGAIEWWLAIVLLVFVAFGLVMSVQRNRR